MKFEIINLFQGLQNLYKAQKNAQKWQVWVSAPSDRGDLWASFDTRKKARQYVKNCKQNFKF